MMATETASWMGPIRMDGTATRTTMVLPTVATDGFARATMVRATLAPRYLGSAQTPPTLEPRVTSSSTTSWVGTRLQQATRTAVNPRFRPGCGPFY